MNVFLVSHELSLTGAPLLVANLGAYLRDIGAQVEATTLKRDDAPGDLFDERGIKTVPPELSFWKAAQADLVVANTAVAKDWVRAFLDRFPEAAGKLIWWIHENDTALYGENMDATARVAAVVFESHAAEKVWRDHGLRCPERTRTIHAYLRESFRRAAERERHPFPDEASALFRPTKDIPRNRIRRRLGVGEEVMLVTLIGAYSEYKGHDLLTRTVGRMLSENPTIPIRLLLVGFRGERQRWSFLKRLNKHEYRAVGRKRAVTVNRDLAAYYAASDVFVMNTQGSGETFGLVTLEAMAFGLPVLGTDAGGTPEIVVAGETGYLFPVGESGQRELERLLYELLNDRDSMRQMGAAGRRRVMERFTAERFFEQWEELIREVIERRAD